MAHYSHRLCSTQHDNDDDDKREEKWGGVGGNNESNGIAWYGMALHGMALHCIALHGIAWHCDVRLLLHCHPLAPQGGRPAHVNLPATFPGYFPHVNHALLSTYSSRIGHYSTILPLRMQDLDSPEYFVLGVWFARERVTRTAPSPGAGKTKTRPPTCASGPPPYGPKNCQAKTQ